MITSIHSFITQHNLIPPGSTIVLGLSGGPDSIFLLHALAPLYHTGTINLIAAHLDHGWRSNSTDDVVFCKKAAHELNVPFTTAHAREVTIHSKFNGSQEEMGRNLRRAFFKKVAQTHNASLIALAHHAQDQQETFFIRLVRGTTLTGLSSIKMKQGMYVRPLLTTNKKDILQYLHTHTISYLEDPTNQSPAFLRNRIRTSIIPAFATADKRFDNAFAATLSSLQETEEFLSQLTNSTLADLTTSTGTLNLKKWTLLHPFLQKKVLVLWLYNHKLPLQLTASFINEISRFLATPHGGNHTLHSTWLITKKQGTASIVVKA
jgi:tRNA(Ile)-lysidine synthase